MIDWATVIVRCDHHVSDVDAGLFLILEPDGSISRGHERQFQVVGSHDSRVTVRSHAPDAPFGTVAIAGDSVHQSRDRNRSYLWIDGNPAKWVQGHNCWGTDDPDLITWWILDILRRLRLSPVLDSSGRIMARVNRLDVTRSFRLDSDADVSAWLRGAERFASLKYRGRGNIGKGQTLYWGQNSRRWALKAYSKSKELSDNALPSELAERDRIRGWCCGILRVESRYYRMELRRRGINLLSDLSESQIRKLWDSAVNGLTFQASTVDLSRVTRAAAGTYSLWRSGCDPQSVLPRATWYRHRRELKRFGVDIAVPRPDDETPVPGLSREIWARPARVPEWVSSPWSVAA